MRRGKVSSSPPRNYRNQPLNHRSASLRRGIPGYGLGRHRPVKPRTSIYARIDQLYGTTPAVPSVHEACSPDRRVNNNSAALPPFLLPSHPSTHPADAPSTRRPTSASEHNTYDRNRDGTHQSRLMAECRLTFQRNRHTQKQRQ
jgi:hypothetical protein